MDSPTNDGTCDAHPVTDEPFIDVRETHTAVVVLAGDRAFKAKKPVVTDFCDFRTAEQRERACIREFELNSRLAAQSYLGIAHLSDPSGGHAEPVVVMRRYRDKQRLASMVPPACRSRVPWTRSLRCWPGFTSAHSVTGASILKARSVRWRGVGTKTWPNFATTRTKWSPGM